MAELEIDNINDKLNLEQYKAVCHILTIHAQNKKRYDEKINEIVQMKSRMDILTDGGDGTSKAERYLQEYEKFSKTPLAQMVSIVESAFNHLKFIIDDDGYTERLICAIVDSCKDIGKNKYRLVNEFYKLGLSHRSFARQKRMIVEDIAVRLGYIDLTDNIEKYWKKAQVSILNEVNFYKKIS